MEREKYGIYFFLFFSLLFSLNLRGQTALKYFKGTIVDYESKEILENVICEALDQSRNVVSYDISGADGGFSLSTDRHIQSISFKLFGYKKTEIATEEIHDHDNIRIELRKDLFLLNEIIITVPPIQKSNDTIRYNVSVYKGQEDRYAVDVLKKLPGIKVNDNGSISYQGEAISKFYIEGRDLLGGQYGQATNNLTVEAISQVEILENHQHVKAMKGIEFSEKAAINIQLKKGYTVKPFGEIQLGAGGLPAIYDEKLFVIHLDSKIQTIANFKINNTGNNVLDELEDKLDVSDLLSYEPLPENLFVSPSPQNISLTDNRYLFNKTCLGSINNLFALSKNTEIRSNFSYGYNYFKQDFFSRQNYADATNPLQINEQNNLASRINNYRFSFIVENNSFNKYIKNESVLYGKRENTHSGISADTRRLEIDNKNRPSYMQNYFQALFKYSGDKTVKINSFTRYSNNNELLNVESKGDDHNPWEESFRGEYLSSKNRAGVSGNLLGQRLGLGIDVIYKRRNLGNFFSQPAIEVPQGLTVDNSENKTELFQTGISPDYQIKSGHKLVTIIQVPLTYSIYKAKNHTPLPWTDERWLFMPSITNNYKINHRWELYTRLGYDFRYADDKSLLTNPYFRNYRTIYIPSNTLNSSKNYNASTRVKYKDLAKLLFFNLHVLYRVSLFDFINKLSYSPDWSSVSTEKKNNTGSQFFINSDLSKTFTPVKLTLTFNPSYMQMKSQFIQQSIFISNTSHSAILSLKTELKSIKKTTLVYQTNGSLVWNNNHLTDRTTQKGMNQKFLIYYFPKKNMDVSTVFEYSLLERDKNRYDSYVFWDISGMYKYKKLEFGIVLSNILDKNTYSTMSLSTINSNDQLLPLRGREVLFTAKMNF
ncbi:MAG: hypothetical protein LBH19_00925 [Dysgonamonadaceae bacterium]|jgi:hypothetical protein|nr:hypothetical protein [Dysgonamonadaceae bacterium]